MAIGSLLRFSQTMNTRYWRVPFILMLILLHLAAMRGAQDYWARGLMLAHFGLFIMWQPFMRGEERLNVPQTVGIFVISAVILLFLNWWLLALWTGVFAGIVGGKVFLFHTRWLRRFYLSVLLYILMLLLVWIVPNMLLGPILPPEQQILVEYGLPLLFVAMAFMPVEVDWAESPQIVDFFYATLIFLLLVVLVLGSLAFMKVGGLAYGQALVYSLLIIATVLLLLSLAWNPRAGFAGLSMYFSRYLLSIGLPFEQWLSFLAELSQLESSSDRFLRDACGGLARLQWVTGGLWRTANESGQFGDVSKNSVEYTNQDLHLRVFTRHKLSPSLLWHFHLLGQLLGEFYIAKRHEEKLQQQTYLQAVHETGARMTHDVKNLLQSLNVLCAAAERDDGADVAELNALMRRQLPAITRRLQETLDKLVKPQAEAGRFIEARIWWDALQRSFQGREVQFEPPQLDNDVPVPKDLFDSTADNFLQNALKKRKLDASIAIRARLACGEAVDFSVSDSGQPVAATVLGRLLRAPVPSETGFGIGLYQAARLSENTGFSISLSANEPGNVCFSLRGKKMGSE
ncbi:MAG: HAMP domain-containing histidine kinase [Betaproteobacteria bacterium]|nr:HAMP domain-containing histidine kinase [Betaproteobacteria bacterium]